MVRKYTTENLGSSGGSSIAESKMQEQSLQSQVDKLQDDTRTLEVAVMDAIAIKHYRDGSNDMRRACIQMMKDSGVDWGIVRMLVSIKLSDPSFPVGQ